MSTLELFERLATALAIGLLIGLERGWQQRGEREGERAAGLRTHALSGLLGGAWGVIAREAGAGGAVAAAIAFATFSAAIVVFRLREAVHDQTFGATTIVAAMLAFTLGAMAVLGDMAAAAAAAVAATGLLALKSGLHAWIRRLTWVELRSALVLLAMTFLLLPILPNRALDPLGAVNPYEIWLLTVLMAALSFAGYLAIKVAGERLGIALTGLAGGLVSSTGATLTLARLAREHPGRERLMAGGALLAGATMMVRVVLVAGVIRLGLAAKLAPALLLAAGATAGLGLHLVRRPADGEPGAAALDFQNPLDLSVVLRLGAILTLVGVLAQVATRIAGSAGAFTVAAISGLADVDALTLSMARMAGAALPVEAAATAVLIAVAVNTVAKAALGWSEGGRALGIWMVAAAALAIGAGALGFMAGPPLLALFGHLR